MGKVQQNAESIINRLPEKQREAQMLKPIVHCVYNVQIFDDVLSSQICHFVKLFDQVSTL